MVLYKPDKRAVLESIGSIQKQVDKLILVNNSEDCLAINDSGRIISVELFHNHGIAYAQNRGIERALELGADYILLSDQDTVYPVDYISSFQPYMASEVAEVLVPAVYDNTKHVHAPVMVGKFRAAQDVEGPVYVQHAIASGTLVSRRAVECAGLMREDLFIDYVDFEWCWRATAAGCRILAVPSVVIEHHLGDSEVRILGRSVALRSDIRYYYMIRNGVHLSLSCPFLSPGERAKLLSRSLFFVCGVILLRRNRSILRLCARAIADGLSGRLGKAGPDP